MYRYLKNLYCVTSHLWHTMLLAGAKSFTPSGVDQREKYQAVHADYQCISVIEAALQQAGVAAARLPVHLTDGPEQRRILPLRLLLLSAGGTRKTE